MKNGKTEDGEKRREEGMERGGDERRGGREVLKVSRECGD